MDLVQLEVRVLLELAPNIEARHEGYTEAGDHHLAHHVEAGALVVQANARPEFIAQRQHRVVQLIAGTEGQYLLILEVRPLDLGLRGQRMVRRDCQEQSFAKQVYGVQLFAL